jgi:beta-lactamase class A
MPLLQSKNRHPELVRTVSYPYRAHGARITKGGTHTLHSGSKNYGRHFAFVFIFGLLGFMFLTPGYNASPKTLGISAKAESSQTQPQEPPLKQLDFSVMKSQIDTKIKAYPLMDIGVAWVDMKTGETGTHGVELPFVAASTGKLFTAIAFLHDVENKHASLTDKVGTRDAKAALEAMIVESDNAAWNDFNNSVMSHKQLAEYAQSIGFADYNPDENTISPASLAKLLNNLHQRRLLNDEHTNLLLSYMQQAKEVEYVTSIAPAGVKVFHKPGFLTDRVHDAMIIDNGDRPYVLVIFTKSSTGSYNTKSGADIFQAIARSTFDTFITAH